MSNYIPKFAKNESDLVILDNIFDAEDCIKYVNEHNMRVLMTCTRSTASVDVMMDFKKNGFNYKLIEEDVYAPDGIKLRPRVLCLFEK